jgi:hypothetical protein
VNAQHIAASLADFAGATLGVDDESKQGKRKMWQLIAIVLAAVLLFYWFAFCGTIWFWMNALFCLCRLHFIRAAIWFVCGCWMMLWWFDKPGRELTWDDGGYLPFAAFWIGLGALGTFVRWRKKQQPMPVPTMPAWTTPPEATGNIGPIIEVEYKRLPN